MNNNSDLISVVVPVYNVEKYIEKCLMSIIKQTYKNLEIIIIDDGSSDNSLDICQKMANIDPRIIIHHKKNGGLSSARNYGLKKSKGDYVIFIDSDDYTSESMIEKMHQSLLENETTLSVCGYIVEYKNEKTYANYKGKEVIESKEAFEQILQKGCFFGSFAWNKLINKKLFRDVLFPEGQFYEDINTMYKLIHKAGKISVVPENLYYYQKRDASITATIDKKKVKDQLHAMSERLDFIADNYPELNEKAQYQLQETIINLWIRSAKKFILDREMVDILKMNLKRVDVEPKSYKSKLIYKLMKMDRTHC